MVPPQHGNAHHRADDPRERVAPAEEQVAGGGHSVERIAGGANRKLRRPARPAPQQRVKREDQSVANRDEHADQHVASHERIANAARQQSAPSDHGFRPDPADVRFERDIQQPHEGRDEHDERRTSGEHLQVAGCERIAHRTGGENEQAQPHRAAAIAAAQTQIAQRQQHGDRNDKRRHGCAHVEADALS